jgi:hypothetical protein
MHLRHIDPRSLEWKDAMLDETRPGFEVEGEQELEAATEGERGQTVDPPTADKRSMGLSAPAR